MELTLAYDELAAERDFTKASATLRNPTGRRRDSSIVGIYRDALRHKDGSLTVAYEVEMPATMFTDDSLVDIRYDDLARTLAFDKPAGTLIQFRYGTIPDPGYAIINLISSRADQGTHALASLLQASNLDYLRGAAYQVPHRRSLFSMWVRVPPKRRINSTATAFSDLTTAMPTVSGVRSRTHHRLTSEGFRDKRFGKPSSSATARTPTPRRCYRISRAAICGTIFVGKPSRAN